MKILLSRILLIIILPIIDIYVYKKIISILPRELNKRKFRIIYWSISIFLLAFMLIFSVTANYKFRELLWTPFTAVVVLVLIVFIPKVFASVLFLISDFTGIFISRDNSKKLKRYILVFSLIIGVIVEITVLIGVFYGRFNYKVEEYRIEFSELPESFDNYRIVHLSDLHLGSFKLHKSKIAEVVEIVNSLEADLIVFTGDLVNNTTNEAWEFYDILKEISATDGFIAITGNHDYGTYVSWNSEEEFENNFTDLKRFYESMGAKLLLNENIVITRGEESIYIAGIESSGKPPFDELGDIDKALNGIPENSFIIMLSHDPSYWRSNILNYPEINLTLSGHTHSFQLGIYSERYNIRWSPIKYIYDEWHGLYDENSQKLIINSGVGHIAMPARIGAPPEIGVIELGLK